MKGAISKLVHLTGYEICRYSPDSSPLARRIKLLETYAISVVLDVGANTGQFGLVLRQGGYAGRIVSFEPLTAAYGNLLRNSKKDSRWTTFNLALGDRAETAVINIAANSKSSSLSRMLGRHEAAAPESRFVGQEPVEVKTLDSLFGDLCSPLDNVYLKIDTQGYEERVLAGASQALQAIDTVELEMSLVPLYEGERLFPELHGLLQTLGYRLVVVEPGFADRDSGELLQLDGIYHRS